MTKEYDLAISFAGEDREIVFEIAENLSASGYSIFYDSFKKAELWGSELPVMLGEIYGQKSRFCLMIISQNYITKMWTNYERSFAIQNMLHSKNNYILPLKVDDVQVPGLPGTIGYVSISSITLPELCQLIIQKIGNPNNLVNTKIEKHDINIIKQVIELCYSRAIFTRMNSEILLEAMYHSIENTISKVQKLVPKITSQYIQRLVLNIISNLDNIERYRLDKESSRTIGIRMEPDVQSAIDVLKLEVIRDLHKLRREGNISIQLPTTVGSGHFFSLEEANQKPFNSYF